MKLPDAEQLCETLVRELKPLVGPKTAMVGLYTGGAWLAERLHQELSLEVPLGRIDISFYRDDYASAGLKASVKPSRIPFAVEGREILLVDDVESAFDDPDEVVEGGAPPALWLVLGAILGIAAVLFSRTF